MPLTKRAEGFAGRGSVARSGRTPEDLLVNAKVWGTDAKAQEEEAALAALLPPASAGAAVQDTAARDTLFAEFQPLVRRLVRKYGDDTESRRDLEGEIYCLFCELLTAYDPSRGVPLRPYLVRQLTTSVYTAARRRWRQARREVVVEIHEDAAPSNDPPADPSAQWDDDMLMRQVGGLLPGALARLPQRQRQVVIWRYYEHRSFEEIAESLGGVQVSTARSLLRHGLNNLRTCFARAGVSMDGVEP